MVMVQSYAFEQGSMHDQFFDINPTLFDQKLFNLNVEVVDFPPIVYDGRLPVLLQQGDKSMGTMGGIQWWTIEQCGEARLMK
jgi:hypothetical protein